MSDEDIRALFAEMTTAWLQKDAVMFAQAYAADADFTSVRGNRLSGNEAIASAHDRLFSAQYAGTRLTATVQRIRCLRPDLAIAHVDYHLFHQNGEPAKGIGGNPGNTMHAQAVLERFPTGWKIVSFLNMVPLSS
jgi:uncharacterized protein (TIGR02246 family)